MDSPDQPDLLRPRPTAIPTVSVQEVEQQCQDLKTIMTATLVALLVLGFSVNLYLGKQMRMIRAKITESRPVVQRLEVEFRTKEPNMRNFINALQSFALANRDFQPILDRYRVVLPQYLMTANPVSSAPPGMLVPTNPGTIQPTSQAPKPAGK
jgi:hypothetical protein